MAYGLPQLNIIKRRDFITGATVSGPNLLSPVNSPIWFAFTSSFVGTSTDVLDSQLIVEIQVIDQDLDDGDPLEIAGRFKVPPRANNTYVFSPSKILNTYVSYPYNSGGKNYADEFMSLFINSSDFPLLAVDTESVVRYKLKYGLEWNPNCYFTQIADLSGQSLYLIPDTVNYFCQVGDIINVSVDNTSYGYWNGTASVINVFDDATNTFIVTDKIPNADLLAISGGYISGTFNNTQHFFATSKSYYAYNGTRQYSELDTNFTKKYFCGYTASQPVPTDGFMLTYGRTPDKRITVRPNEGWRLRFFADFQGTTGYQTNGLTLNTKVYNTSCSLISTTNVAVHAFYPVVGIPHPYDNKCYTISPFNSSTVITDGYKYDVSIQHQVGGVTYSLATAYFTGKDSCTLYENVRIKFLNRVGSWHYFTFNKDKKQTTTITKTEYNKPMGYDATMVGNNINISEYNEAYSLSKLRGQGILSSQAIETFTLNSDWVTESEIEILNELFSSPEVYIYTNDFEGGYGKNTPIIITDTSYIFKTTNRDRIFNFTVNYKYAFDTNLQNQ